MFWCMCSWCDLYINLEEALKIQFHQLGDFLQEILYGWSLTGSSNQCGAMADIWPVFIVLHHQLYYYTINFFHSHFKISFWKKFKKTNKKMNWNNQMNTLNLEGRALSSLTRTDRPIRVAILQWGMVGVICTFTVFFWSSTCREKTYKVSIDPRTFDALI